MVKCETFILFLLFLNVALFSYNSGHNDGYFDGATDLFYNKVTIKDVCCMYKDCSKNLKEEICK